ncbi:putative UPF0481 protein At3g02645 [Amaranthus tricolor]|uniref:putative UPF0481 protein At3g02645 n=1 Tax=Amaranthus tricolor TaxID=29722 RepID=UPI002588331C|nr:putative UPF0481 protein At3g02645 [Amaranthus tricolor]
MSLVEPKNCCCSSTKFDEHRWVKQIQQIFDEEIEDESENEASIYDVPKALRDTNPNAYTPQLVAIGPYHYMCPKLQEMERYKLCSAKRFQNLKQGSCTTKLHSVVDQFMIIERRIRACYPKNSNIKPETLAWMMAIDAVFVLEICDVYCVKEEKMLFPIISKMVDYNAILRDIIMLENQIPMFVLRQILDFQFQSSDSSDTTLDLILNGLWKHLSPFKMLNCKQIRSSGCEHILDYIYKCLVPKVEDQIVEIYDEQETNDEERMVCTLLSRLMELLGQIHLKLVLQLPLIFVCSLPGFTIFQALLLTHKDSFQDHVISQSIQDNLVEEITIPSVKELSESGVIFMPTNGDIMTINFDDKSKKLYLPTVSIDMNTEILLRNLVAYEASTCSGPSILARYIELMNGIIDTKDDVRLLRERGIILNYLKSEDEVANLWNGMSKSLRLTRVPLLDQVIENVNKYYKRNWKVILYKFIRAYVMNSCKILATLLVSLILLSLILQVLSSFLFRSSPQMVGPQARG